MRAWKWMFGAVGLLACLGCPGEGVPERAAEISFRRGGQLIRGCICPGRVDRPDARCADPFHPDGSITVKVTCPSEAGNYTDEDGRRYCRAPLETSDSRFLQLVFAEILVPEDGKVHAVELDNAAANTTSGVSVRSRYTYSDNTTAVIELAIVEVRPEC